MESFVLGVLLVVVLINLVVLYYQHQIIQQIKTPNPNPPTDPPTGKETQHEPYTTSNNNTTPNKHGAAQSVLPSVAASLINPNTLQSVADIFKYKAEVSTLATVEKAIEEAGDLTTKCVVKTVNG